MLQTTNQYGTCDIWKICSHGDLRNALFLSQCLVFLSKGIIYFSKSAMFLKET